MKFKKIFPIKTFSFLFILMLFFIETNFATVKKITEGKYSYEIVDNDPLKTRLYTLENGLKVYLSVNNDNPSIQTAIAVRAGSTYDPAETTGLAHYLEHMVFKGSDKIGTINWETEKIFLKQIENLYEEHKATNDPEKKNSIYRKIDSISNIASKYVVANEYDKMISSVGAKRTNAFTSHEQTVYINDIPSNQIEKWLAVEGERFSTLVLRLFHTELEAVYEEFNRSQDNDNRKVFQALFSSMYKIHPYGTQTTIGTSEHLKNPSMIKIHEYFNKYYVANNMAVCLSGDLDPAITIELVDKYFGRLKPGVVPEFQSPKEEPVNSVITKEILGPDRESVTLAFRIDDGINSHAEHLSFLVNKILENQQAGIIDLELMQKQKVLSAGAFSYFLKYYGSLILYGNPQEGQTLEEVKDLLLTTIEKVKKGDFEDWLLEAIVNDEELSMIKQNESNWERSMSYVDAFVHSIGWEDYTGRISRLSKITKQQVVDFANENFKNNYVAVYKRVGKDSLVAKVEKPPITPIELNREDHSVFMEKFNKMTSEEIQPVFVDFKKEISKTTLNSGIELSYIKNTVNDLFSLYYVIDMGRFHNKKLSLAVNYLPFLGTDKYSPSEFQKELYKHGIHLSVSASDKRSYINISGLQKSMNKAIELLENLLANVKPDKQAYDSYTGRILKEREDAKLDKGTILRDGLFNYAKYGKHSPFTDILSSDELKNINPAELTDLLKKICSYKHYVFYYGSKDIGDVKITVDKNHKAPEKYLEYPEPTVYPEKAIEKPFVYFVNYDMVQVEMLLLNKDKKFDKQLMPYASLYNSYFGAGLSSIVFQEIREAKGLAYSAYSFFSTPRDINESHYVSAYVGTQANKMKDALPAMQEIMNKMPEASKQFNSAKDAILNKIRSERITKASIFWSYINNLDIGIDYDARKDVYSAVEKMNMEDLKKFFNEHISGKTYALLVLGNKDDVDMEALKKYGELKELRLEEIFNY